MLELRVAACGETTQHFCAFLSVVSAFLQLASAFLEIQRTSG